MSSTAPLVPSDVDLQDFAFMPVDVQRLLKSETWILATGDERAAAITLWLQSWHQVPAGSLPDNDRMLAHLSGSLERWKKVKAHALRGWVTCADGRLYHPVVCEKALEAWIEKLSNSMSGATGNAKRWGIEVDVSAIREKFRLAVELLRTLAPQSRTLKKKVVAVILAGSRPESGGDTPPDFDPMSGGESSPDPDAESPPDSPPESSGDRKGQGQGQGQGLKKDERASSGQPFARARVHEGSMAEQAAQAMRDAGYDAMVAEDPELLAVLSLGITPAEIGAAAVVGRQRRKGPGWVLARAKGRRQDAVDQQAVGVAGAVPAAAPPRESVDEYVARVSAEREAERNRPAVTVDVAALAAKAKASVRGKG